ncbi:MAG: HI0074 family nucleotidyltransferase substrate-binding subunit [Cardiobacteriaceae bacterium]|nr:HI0074 family nucleotidyltransferase substrate-binding subunit [Cardiobacteriaceae bacterium]
MSHFSVLPLENAVDRLAEGLAVYQEDNADIIRDGLIQRFEFSYEISHKILKRFLQNISANAEQFDEMSFADLIRSANKQNLLLGNWQNWKKYRDMRNRTSHTYDEQIAISIVAEIPDFLKEIQYLLVKIKERMNAENSDDE